MISINTNLSSFIIQSNLKTSTNGLNQAIERMTTGFKLNHAKDNAANFSISTSITTKLGAYNTAEENAMMGLDMVQTASSSLETISDKLSRMRALAVQAQNGTYGNDSIDAINSEANALAKEINRIQTSTEYNGKKLFNGQSSTVNTQNLPKISSVLTSDLTPNSDGFIKDVQKRGTSGMASISTLADDAQITSGTYKIETKEDLIKLSKIASKEGNIMGGEFVLAGNIDMSGVDFEGIQFIGKQNNNNTYTTANFDGNGYKISNLNYMLFGQNSWVDVENLGIVNSHIKNKYGSPDQMAEQMGILGGCVHSVNNCYAKGSSIFIEENIGAGYTGGLVGCSVSDIDSSWCDTNISGVAYMAGGLVGVFDSSIFNSFSTGNSSVLTLSLGGLVGYSNSDSTIIKNCYSTGELYNPYTDKDNYGIVSGLGSAFTIENSYSTSRIKVVDENQKAFSIGMAKTLTNVGYDSSINLNISGAKGIDDDVDRTALLTDFSSANLELAKKKAGFISDISKFSTAGAISFSSIDSSKKLTNGTYTISSASELAKLAEMTNNGLIASGIDFVLTSDIDISACDWTPIGKVDEDLDATYAFNANFHGNGHKIKGLTSTGTKMDMEGVGIVGLFGIIGPDAKVENLGIEDVNIAQADGVSAGGGGLACIIAGGNINNCYVTGDMNADMVGGLCYGIMDGGNITNCSTGVNISSNSQDSAVCGFVYEIESGNIENSFSNSTVSGANACGFVGENGGNISNCYVTGNVNGIDNSMNFIATNQGTIDNCYTTITGGAENGVSVVTGAQIKQLQEEGILPTGNNSGSYTGFFVGINSDDSSVIGADFSFGFEMSVDLSSSTAAGEALKVIDSYIKEVNAKQVEFGSVQNRLESVLESIGVSIDNLTSTQSTIRDADIANLSSEYIRNQILQQAAATLLATANQTPAIALQLL